MRHYTSKHVGGANRTIIKLAQQLLIHPEVALAERAIGDLARLDQIYDLIESNIAGEVRGKINKIPEQVDHRMAQPVAKAICLLQFVKSVHRTAENIAASLYPALGAPSQLETVKDALRALEAAHLVRHGEDGYRIPTPAEDDWDRVRNGMSPKPSDTNRIHREILTSFWKPQPTHTLLDVKPFKGGLVIDGREEEKGDLAVHLALAEEGNEFTTTTQELRTRSQQVDDTIFWAVPLTNAIDRETVELFRSREMESRKGRDARTADETALIAEERTRGRHHLNELQRLLRSACLSGSAYFLGNDRSPDGKATDVGKAASTILAQVLPGVFTRFVEGAAKSGDVKRGLDALLSAADLQGLPSVFTELSLLRDEGGKTVFDTDAPALRELFSEIEHGANYGQKATGKSLSEKLGRAPFGWDFDVVRLFIAVLLRAGAIQMTHKSQPVDSATSVAAKDALTNNNYFRAASFQPKKGVDFAEIAKAAEHFKATFGAEVKELALSPVVAQIQDAVVGCQDEIENARDLIVRNRLPGLAVLDDALAQMKTIQRSTENAAVAEFNSSFQTIKDGIRRSAELSNVLTGNAIEDLRRAQRIMQMEWPVLDEDPSLSSEIRDSAKQLADLLQRETFFRDLAHIDQRSAAISKEYRRRFDEALTHKVTVYRDAIGLLVDTPGWAELNDEAKEQIAKPLRMHADDDGAAQPPIAQLRADLEACVSRLRTAIQTVHQIVEGGRVATVNVQPFFRGGVEDTEQLEAALAGLREECERLIADGKKIVVQ